MINFSKPYLTGNEISYISECILSKSLKGDGPFTNRAQLLLKKLYVNSEVFLTTSCTDALEMIALLLDIKNGDEVIIPSYTFVSTALAFEMRGATIIFADSEEDRPHLDVDKLQDLITKKTRAIVAVHYAGEACDMNKLLKLIDNTQIQIIEDNAQGITSMYNKRQLGTFGVFGALSFHDSKNIICGEGGAIIINDPQYIKRAEIIREKGTNRSQFFRGGADKYNWVDIGSSYLPSDILAAFLVAQLEKIEEIQVKRINIWKS